METMVGKYVGGTVGDFQFVLRITDESTQAGDILFGACYTRSEIQTTVGKPQTSVRLGYDSTFRVAKNAVKEITREEFIDFIQQFQEVTRL